MRNALAQAIEIVGLAAVTCGVGLALGAGAALIVGGVLLAGFGALIERGGA
ncbi:MAG: hypothetical protein IRZ28_11150 [Steroidobacteraceae bacterium]|nr:hypothetical protein [Steroidobacteraceae bacterium]